MKILFQFWLMAKDISVVGFVGELLEVVGGFVVVVTIGSMRKSVRQ